MSSTPDTARPASILRQQLYFTLLSGVFLLCLYSLLRLLLLLYNLELAASVSGEALLASFANGLRFDLRLTAYILLPLLLSMLSVRAMQARQLQRIWLTTVSSITCFLGIVELDFYREFHQRLNSLVFQYFSEDPGTVLSMLWHGFPVVSYLMIWILATGVLYLVFARIDTFTAGRYAAPSVARLPPPSWTARFAVFTCCLLFSIAAARGTLQQGPPMRWGAAYTTEFLFSNQLGLNGTLSLADAARAQLSSKRDNIWKPTLPAKLALSTVRSMIVSADETLIDADSAAIRRIMTTQPSTPTIRNVVVILLESFAGHYVGALGGKGQITPYFDQLSREGLLFTRFFANGTHTHQGMFATLACFPNLPGFEYLMQQPEGSHHFSGLSELLQQRNYDDVYLYNGDFAWDNQEGFFRNQGMQNFIGRHDFVDPFVSDPTWGVSDQDMFNRAISELQQRDGRQPFYAVLQSLSNHTPYALPEVLPVEPVTGFGHLDEHLSAMRYSDWALGQFFTAARQLPYFDQTLFVILGDHGFGTPEQLTDMDLYRFHVPLLLIAPGLHELGNGRTARVGTQVDVVPTIMGLLGGQTRHQCWGRDLLNLPPDDAGFGIIKPSGNDQTVALITGERVLVQPRGQSPALYRYQLNKGTPALRLNDAEANSQLQRQLEAYLQTATQSLLENTTGTEAEKAPRLINSRGR